MEAMKQEVRIKDEGHQIRANIPFPLKDRIQANGIFEKKTKTWRYPRTSHAAFRLCYDLREYITKCDRSVGILAQDYDKALQAKKKDDGEQPILDNLRTPLWKHQRHAYHVSKFLQGCALLMGMGTGKSITAISALQSRQREKNLIVCPKSVLDVWPEEFDKHLDEPMILCAPYKGTIQTRAKRAADKMDIARARGEPFILLVNYEAFWRGDYAKLIQGVTWDNIIYDECHKLKDPTASAAKFSHKLVGNSHYRLGLTGTFMPRDPLDAFSQYRALDPSVFGNSYYRYKLRYAQMGGFGGKQVIGFINQEELNQKIEAIGIQVENEVLDLPDATHSRRKCTLNTQTRRVYDEIDQELHAEVDSGEITVANAMVKVLRLQQLTSGHIKQDDGSVIAYGEEKKQLLEELMSDIPKDEPIVVFARFTRDIQNIKEVAEKLGRTPAELSGQVRELKKFQNGEANVIALQVKSGGLGIDLTRSCYCIFYSIGHSLGDYDQMVKRIHRPGQTRTVRYYYLIAKNTKDNDVFHSVQQKRDIVDYIMKGIKEGQQTKELVDE